MVSEGTWTTNCFLLEAPGGVGGLKPVVLSVVEGGVQV